MSKNVNKISIKIQNFNKFNKISIKFRKKVKQKLKFDFYIIKIVIKNSFM